MAVAPELQGRGYGTRLMQALVPHMREQGFHLSRLGGLMAFYSRFGYEPFLRRYVQIPVQPILSELKGQRWGDLLMIPDDLSHNVHFYDPSRHQAGVYRLRRESEAGRSGQLAVPDTPPPPSTAGPNLSALEWTYEQDGVVRGYLRGSFDLVNAGDAAPAFGLGELLYDHACPEAAGVLVKTLMWRAAHIAPTRIHCRLPYDERLFRALTDAGIAYEVVEMRQSLDGNMMRVVGLRETLEAVTPELGARLRQAGLPLWKGAVSLRLPGEQAALEIGEGEVRLAEVSPATEVRCSQADFIRFLLGIVGFGEHPWLSAELTPAQRLTLGVLFPRLPCASGPWG